MLSLFKSKNVNLITKYTIFILAIFLLAACKSDVDDQYFNPTKNFTQHSFNQEDQDLLKEIKRAFKKQKVTEEHSNTLKTKFTKSTFPKKFWAVGITIYNPKHKMIRTIITKGDSPEDIFVNSVSRTIKHLKRKKLKFDLRSKIQVDFIIEPPVQVPYDSFLYTKEKKNTFELGVDGAIISKDKDKIFFLPGDAYTKSIHYLGQFEKYAQKKLKIKDRKDVHNLNYQRFKTISFVNYKSNWVSLYRGIPHVGELSEQKIKTAIERAINHIIKYQQADGRFLYYYDAGSNSHKDHEHPKRDPKENPYYNILRHIGGGLTLLDYYETQKNDKVILPLEKSMEFLIKNLKSYQTKDKKEAEYVFYNEKAKLGGSGLALLLFSRYKILTGKNTFDEHSDKIANHLLEQIQESGEFYYYSVFLNQQVTSPEMNKNLFNFYYPGEAICGLAFYLKTLNNLDRSNLVKEKTKLALDFLLNKRPLLYKQHYTSLPSDSWLMMGINFLWDIEDMRVPKYAEFVFNDADQMVNHMYTVKDAPYPDYAGAFYYNYGQSYFPDGARAEGLDAAYKLSKKIGDKKRTEKYSSSLNLAAWSIYHLVNSPESMYFAKNPKKSIGGIRFKPTRQWFRIDTMQHVISFYMKFFYLG